MRQELISILVRDRRPMEPEGDEPRPVRVTLAQAGYLDAPPNRQRRSCQRCVLWMASDAQCLIHDAEVIAPPTGICRKNIYGEPYPGGSGDAISRNNIQEITPAYSGLRDPGAPVGCDMCGHYERKGATVGVCLVNVNNDGSPMAAVEAFGFCGRSTQLAGAPDEEPDSD